MCRRLQFLVCSQGQQWTAAVKAERRPCDGPRSRVCAFCPFFIDKMPTTPDGDHLQPPQLLPRRDLLVVKIGGACITDKARHRTLRPERLSAVAKDLGDAFRFVTALNSISAAAAADDGRTGTHPQPRSTTGPSAVSRRSITDLVIIHGAGSFAHMEARQFNLVHSSASQGSSPLDARRALGLAQGIQGLQLLSSSVIRSLLDEAHIPVVPIDVFTTGLTPSPTGYDVPRGEQSPPQSSPPPDNHTAAAFTPQRPPRLPAAASDHDGAVLPDHARQRLYDVAHSVAVKAWNVAVCSASMTTDGTSAAACHPILVPLIHGDFVLHPPPPCGTQGVGGGTADVLSGDLLVEAVAAHWWRQGGIHAGEHAAASRKRARRQFPTTTAAATSPRLMMPRIAAVYVTNVDAMYNRDPSSGGRDVAEDSATARAASAAVSEVEGPPRLMRIAVIATVSHGWPEATRITTTTSSAEGYVALNSRSQRKVGGLVGCNRPMVSGRRDVC